MRDSFIVEFWSQIFSFLGRISIFALLRSHFGVDSYRWVDIWVLSQLTFSILAIIVVGFYPESIIALLFVLYGAYRVFEINVYQINVLLFDEYRAKKEGQKYAVRGYRRTVLLLLHNYVEVIFWFGSSYIFFADYFTYKWEGGYKTIIGALYSSFIAMSTFGDFNMNPKHAAGAIILFFQSASGLFMTLLSIARFVSILPRPATLDQQEAGYKLKSNQKARARRRS